MMFGSATIVKDFAILSVNAVGGFHTKSSGSIELGCPTKSGTWWYEESKVRIATPDDGDQASERLHDDLLIWPDCAGELIHVDEYNTARLVEMPLTFAAVGRVDWDLRLVRGLILHSNEDQKSYTRWGMFQASDRDGFRVQDWDIQKLEII